MTAVGSAFPFPSDIERTANKVNGRAQNRPYLVFSDGREVLQGAEQDNSGFSPHGRCGLLVSAMRAEAALGLLGVILTPRGAFAEDVYLDYSVSEGCPSREQFESQVVARTALVRFVHEPHSGRFFRVYAGTDSAIAVGRLTSGRGSEEGRAREVSSENCDDVVSAMALIVALSIDPKASLALNSPPATAFPSEPAPQAPVTPTPNLSSTVVRPGFSAPINWGPPFVAPMRGGTRPSSPRSIAFELGARISGSLWLTSPIVPWGAFGASLGAESIRPTIDAALVQLSMSYAKSTTVHTEEGAGARFDTWMLGLEYCPLRFVVAAGVVLRPCAEVEGGRLRGAGVAAGRINHAWSINRLSGAISQQVRLQFQLKSGWHFIVDGGLSEPFGHDRFVFISPTTQIRIVTVPFVVPRLSFGLSVRFW